MDQEKKVVTWSMVVLFMALMIIYTVLYMTKPDLFLREPTDESEDVLIMGERNGSRTGTENQLGTGGSGGISSGMLGGLSGLQQTGMNTGENTSPFAILPNTQTGGVTTGNTLYDLDANHSPSNTGISEKPQTVAIVQPTLLSGTTLFFGVVESFDTIGAQSEYLLKDDKNIYYGYLGTGNGDFTSVVRKLGGTVYTMASEKEIADNQLFGDKISFINLPEYKDKKVVMVLHLGQKLRLIQIDYDTYHKSKDYLKTLFY